jgi:hypothetical protein
MNEDSGLNDQKTKLERKTERLYTDLEYTPTDRRGKLHNREYDANTEWVTLTPSEEVSTIAPPRSSAFSKLAKLIFIMSVLVFLGSASFAAYKLFFSTATVASEKVLFQINTPSFADGGEEFDAEFVIANQNKTQIELVDIIVDYPKGDSLESESEVVRTRISVGTIKPGEIKRVREPVSLYGREGNERAIKASLEYAIPGSSAIFNKYTDTKVTLKSSPVTLSLDSVKEIASNQSLTLTAKIKAERGKDLDDFVVKLQYPNGFQFVDATPSPRFGNDTWIFDSIEKGATEEISINGIMKGEDGDERTFRILGGQPSREDPKEIGVVYAETKQVLTLDKPFISLTGVFDGKQLPNGDYAIGSGDRVQGTITYQNNLSESINDVIITAKLTGEVLDKRSVRVNGGYYDSTKNLLIWSKSTLATLGEVYPGQKSTLTFSFSPYPLTAKTKGIFREPTVTLNLSVKASRFTDDRVPLEVVIPNPVIAKVTTAATLYATALKTTGPLQNEGPVPPRAEQESTYTLYFALTNTSNKIENAELTFTLPPYAKLTGAISPSNEQYTFSQSSRVVSWKVGDILPETGIGSKPSREMYLQVAVTPSIVQLGSSLDLTDAVILTGIDAYTSLPVKLQIQPVTNRTATETTYRNLDEMVVQ